MSRRLEGIRVDQPVPSNPQEVARSAAGQKKTVERREFKAVTARKNVNSAAVETEASQPSEAAASSFADRGDSSLDEILTELVRPRITDLSILRRAALLLAESAEIFDLEEGSSDSARILAARLIADEIDRHEMLVNRLQRGVQADDVT